MKNIDYRNKTIFVDFNGVLCHDPFWHSLRDEERGYHAYSKLLERFLFEENRNLFEDWMIGKHTSEEINKKISEAIGIRYDILFNIFQDDCRSMKISRQMLQELRLLKKDYYLILSTGNVDAFDRFILPSVPMMENVFDEIHNSYNLGRLKSTDNGQYFIDVIQGRKISFTDCFLIDDSVSTCSIFSSHGGKSFCMDKEAEVLECLKGLRNLS